AQGMQVHFFLRGERYWNNVLDETESIIIENRLKNEGVQIHYHTELSEILTQSNRVIGVKTKDGRHIRCELCAYAIGVLPRIELAQAAGLKIDRGILTDQFMTTSDPDIFAAGDVAQIFDPFSGKSVLDTLWSPARNSGANAGLNMTGMQVPFQKYIAYNVTRLAGLTTTIIGSVGRGIDPSLVGIARGDSETWRMLPNAVIAEKSHAVNRLRLVVGEKHLLGAIVMGEQALSIPLQELVAQQVDITSVRENLLQTHQLGDVTLSFWEHWRSQRAHQKS
ncbi:MAG: FAD-dependent oxidoreductase, partial [Anaerolineaceae bacterium]|nr:FAD-dependent oxidoreductase [Anaerolineaceae bacterium]